VDPEARLAIVDALATIRDDAAKEALRGAANDDPDAAVRAHVRAVAAAGDASGAVRNDGVRPRLDYMWAMAPYDPSADRPLYTPRAFVHTRRGVIEIHLNTVEAPLAVQTFIALARRGFFNELDVHRTVSGARVEAGCPRGDGLGGPGFRIRREAGLRPFGRGAVGLDAAVKDTEGSRFFIATAPDPMRDGNATLLGNVVMGMDVVDALRAGDEILWVEIWEGR
jgi:peptidyl-prolyl cis-trans isomerase B (cyclophilin B)